MYLSIGQAAVFLGVSISTLRRWESEQSFFPDYRTKGGHRRYSFSRLQTDILASEEDISSSDDKRKVIAYARVSSHDQKLDLLRQQNRLSKYCASKNLNYEIISDLGSGLNYNKKGLTKLIDMICRNQVSQLILTHKDRLLRFGSTLLFKLCKFYGTKVIVLEEQEQKSFEQELVADVIELMTVFTAKMHGKRSHRNKKALKKSA